MEPGPAGAGAHFGAGAGMQLAAGARRRNRFRARAVATWTAGRAGHDQRLDSETGSSSDIRMYQAGFRDEHRRATELRCEHAVLAGQSVRDAVLYAGAAAIPL